MKYFLLKKPTNLFLIPEPYSANVPVPSVLQVRYKGNQSNSKLVKCRNGQWYIKNGSYMIELKSVPSNPMKIVSMNEEGGTFVDEVNSKWFLHNKK